MAYIHYIPSEEASGKLADVTAYYAYVNRIADGLGVELEEFWETEEKGGGC